MKTDLNKAQNPSAVKPEAIDALVAFICVEASSIESAQPHLDTIRAMCARMVELEGALKPFAGAAERMATEWSVWEDHESHWSGGYAGLNVGDLRAAGAALKNSNEFVRLGIAAARVVANCESAGSDD